MKLPDKFHEEWDGPLQCEVCNTPVNVDDVVDAVDAIYTKMLGEADVDYIYTQHNEDTTEYVLCKNCSLRVEVTVKPRCISTKNIDGKAEQCIGIEGHRGRHSNDNFEVTNEPKIPLGSSDDSHA